MQPLVAVVDDEKDFLILVERFLRRHYRVAVFSRSEDACAGIEAAGPDVLVLDAHMPVVSGFEICRRLRAQPRFATLPVLFLTGSESGDDIARFQEVRGTAYLVKPIDPQDLVKAVDDALRRRPDAPQKN